MLRTDGPIAHTEPAGPALPLAPTDANTAVHPFPPSLATHEGAPAAAFLEFCLFRLLLRSALRLACFPAVLIRSATISEDVHSKHRSSTSPGVATPATSGTVATATPGPELATASPSPSPSPSASLVIAASHRLRRAANAGLDHSVRVGRQGNFDRSWHPLLRFALAGPAVALSQGLQGLRFSNFPGPGRRSTHPQRDPGLGPPPQNPATTSTSFFRSCNHFTVHVALFRGYTRPLL